MTETETLVYVDLASKPYLAGRLWTRMDSAFEHAETQKALAGKPVISPKAPSKSKRKQV